MKVILRNRWYTLRIIHMREYIGRFKGLKWKEVHLKYVDGVLYVSIVFEVTYKPYTPRGAVAIDSNLKQIATYDGSGVKRFRARFVDALGRRARAEEIQRKHSRRWRYNEKILNKALHRKARNIVIDWCRKFAKELILKARGNGYVVVLEDLEYLRKNIAKNGNSITWKLSMFAYRKLQEVIVSKAIEYNVPVAFIDPRNTSSTCPRCGVKLSYIHRLFACLGICVILGM